MRICMHSTKDIIEEASSLPVEERIIGVDSLLKTRLLLSRGMIIIGSLKNTDRV